MNKGRNVIKDAMLKSHVTKELAEKLELDQPFLFDITPDIAETILAVGNTYNRVPSTARVKGYAAAMHRGEWKFSGDPIRFYTDFKLADGQHRLQAIALSKTIQKTVIVPNLSHDCFTVIDTGKSRTPKDAFEMEGHEHAGIKSTACGVALRWMVHKRIRNTQPPTTNQILVFESTYSTAFQEIVSWSAAITLEYGRLVSAGYLAATVMIHYLHKGDLDRQFMTFLEESLGDSQEKGSVEFYLRTLLETSATAKTQKAGKLTQEMMIGSLLKAYKMKGNKTKVTDSQQIKYPKRPSDQFSVCL